MNKRRFIILFTLLGAPTLAATTTLGLLYLASPDPTQLKQPFTYHPFNSKKPRRVDPSPPYRLDYVPKSEISPFLISAVIVSEDSTFFQHGGFDWYELKKALALNLQKARFARGASTLSQQLVRNVYLGPQKSLWRKLQEAVLTWKLESRLTKDKILELYLNVVEWGPNLYGIRQAAQHYFRKHPRALLPSESAFLTYLLPNPRLYSALFTDRRLTPHAKKKMKKILLWMKGRHMITQVEYTFSRHQVGDPDLLFNPDLEIPTSFSEPERIIDYESILKDEPNPSQLEDQDDPESEDDEKEADEPIEEKNSIQVDAPEEFEDSESTETNDTEETETDDSPEPGDPSGSSPLLEDDLEQDPLPDQESIR